MNAVLETIVETGIVAIVRSDSASGLIETVRALSAGGVRAVEVTMTTPGALEAIAAAAGEAHGRYIIGAGSVLDAAAAGAAIDAGAEFLVAPNVCVEAIELAKARGKVICPGALTPTEIAAAWNARADVVKVFPASHFGAAYLEAILAPMPHLRLMPVGGVNLDNAAAFIRAGACALGVGGSLVNARTIARGDWPAISDAARRYVETVTAARTPSQK